MDKTAIVRLEIICAQNDIQPLYVQTNRGVEGSVHQPNYIFTVKVKDYTATGSGQSQKNARHAAAYEMIKKLVDDKEFKIAEISEIRDWLKTMDEMSQTQQKPEEEVNYVGRLKEYCDKKNWPQAYYDTVDEEGPPHDRMFSIACRLDHLGLVFVGTGKSKANAKRQSAGLMMKKLIADEEKELHDVEVKMEKTNIEEKSSGSDEKTEEV